MNPTELKLSRNEYGYVPARLISAVEGVRPDIEWKSLKLVMDVPTVWTENSRGPYSSSSLDDFHCSLLHSESDEELFHGLLSTIFWGFASGADGRIRTGRALERCRWILEGRLNSAPQNADEVLSHLRNSRELLRAGRISEALLESAKIKFLGMSFASKVLAFMSPQTLAVYDDVISKRLEQQEDPELRRLYVSTKIATSNTSKTKQARIYEKWCRWCLEKATALNASGESWRDWDSKEKAWRAIDVERAFFALGRSALR